MGTPSCLKKRLGVGVGVVGAAAVALVCWSIVVRPRSAHEAEEGDDSDADDHLHEAASLTPEIVCANTFVETQQCRYVKSAMLLITAFVFARPRHRQRLRQRKLSEEYR